MSYTSMVRPRNCRSWKAMGQSGHLLIHQPLGGSGSSAAPCCVFCESGGLRIGKRGSPVQEKGLPIHSLLQESRVLGDLQIWSLCRDILGKERNQLGFSVFPWL